MNLKFYLAIILVSISLQSFSQLVNNQQQLDNAISNANAGTTITLANGNWNDVDLEINKFGTLSAPIIIEAETAGSVFFEGDSKVAIGGEYIVFKDVVFQNPSNISTGTPIIKFKSSDNCNNCTVTNIKIDSYNGTSSQAGETFKWMLLYGQYNEISYSSFIGKYGVGSIINDNRETTDPDYSKIHHNFFGYRTPYGIINEYNDQDAIRIGNSATSLHNSFTEVYDNFFYSFFGEVEIISNKSCNNKYYNNTFKDYSGTLTLRHGNDCEVFGNYFFADNNLLSGGVRVIGENHKVYNNYIEGVSSLKPDNSNSKATGGINVTNGRLNTAINGYYQVKNTSIVNNTFVNCDFGIRVGTQVKSDLSEEPENLIVANNIMLNTSNKAIEETTTPSGNSIYEGNIKQNGSWDISNNLTVSANLLVSNTDFYTLPNNSPAINAAVGTYSFLTNDILGGVRSTSNYDAGAEEYGSTGNNLPYTLSDVGINIGFGANLNISILDSSTETLNFTMDAGTLSFALSSNLNWIIQESEPWLSVSVISGSGSMQIFVSVTENTTAFPRSTSITIFEVGGSNLQTIINVNQSSNTFNPLNEVEIPVVTVTGVGTENNINIPENVTNDIIGDRWSGEAADGSANLTFDLGCIHTLTKSSIYFHKGDERNSYFKILLSTDSINFVDNFGLLSSNQITGFQDFDLQLYQAQYVKIEGYGNSNNDWNSYEEIKFFGDTSCFSIPIVDTTSCQNIDYNFNVAYDQNLTVTWNNTENASYVFYIRQAGTLSWFNINLDLPIATVNNLIDCTTYEFKVETICANNSTFISPINSFATSNCAGQCFSNIFIYHADTEINSSGNISVNNYIKTESGANVKIESASNFVNGSNIVLTAANYIEVNAGFEIYSGADALLQIEDCD